MDWFTWLSKTNLHPSLVHEYALTFTDNELVEDDIAYFGHECLQSMGVSIAKHRLEILKLARKKKMRRIHPVLWFTFAFKQTKNYISKQIQAFVHRENTPLSLVPKRNDSLRWKVTMLQRNKRLRGPSSKPEWPMLNHGILMLTNGSSLAEPRSSSSTQSSSDWVESEANAESVKITRDDYELTNPCDSSFSRTMVCSPECEYWLSNTEEIKWDSMFHNLKPT